MAVHNQSWFRQERYALLIVLAVLASVMLLLALAQRNDAGNKIISTPGQTSSPTDGTTTSLQSS
ncbi:MAG: hypothetical protein DLM55_00230 [Acidimicrobiales bacterium]|nr:MAG: hypothetical protein DLM55_00230 [Acidimicrobiales bacterium]